MAIIPSGEIKQFNGDNYEKKIMIMSQILICFFIIFFCCDASSSVKKRDVPLELIDSDDGILELQIESPKNKSIPFFLENLPNADRREISLEELELRSINTIVKGGISPKEIILEPGMRERITVNFSEFPKGDYEGILTIRDLQSKTNAQEFIIKVKSPFLVESTILCEFHITAN